MNPAGFPGKSPTPHAPPDIVQLINSARNSAPGMTLPQAFDAVLGEGAYAKLAGDLYDALRAKAA